MDTCWTVATQSACLPIFRHSFRHAWWCGASITISAMSVGVTCQCQLAWCLNIGHAVWSSATLWCDASLLVVSAMCIASLSTMPTGGMPHYMPYLWSVATATGIFTSQVQTEEGSYKSGIEVITLEYSIKLKIKRNDWLLAECHQATNHCGLF